MPVCRDTPNAAIRVQTVLITKSCGRQILCPLFDAAMNIVMFFWLRGVTAV